MLRRSQLLISELAHSSRPTDRDVRHKHLIVLFHLQLRPAHDVLLCLVQPVPLDTNRIIKISTCHLFSLSICTSVVLKRKGGGICGQVWELNISISVLSETGCKKNTLIFITSSLMAAIISSVPAKTNKDFKNVRGFNKMCTLKVFPK